MSSLSLGERTLIWLDSFSDIDRKKKVYLFELLEGATEIKKTIQDSLSVLKEVLTEKEISKILDSANNVYFESLISNLEKNDVKAITYLSKGYPKPLLELKDYPLVIYCKGNYKLLNERLFSVVGSRRSLPASIELTKTFSKTLSGAGFTMVSGYADGIDKTVLESALNCGSSPISVVAGGIDEAISGSMGQLLERVAKQGLIISEKPLKVNPKPFYFPLRNRLIAVLGEGLLVINGSMNSGVKYTYQYATEYGKKVFAIPYGVGIASGEITNHIIKQGAMLVTEPSEVLKEYSLKTETQKKEIELIGIEKEIFELVKERPTHIEEMCARLNKAVYEITPTLSMLEIKGIIVKVGVNVYGRLVKTEE